MFINNILQLLNQNKTLFCNLLGGDNSDKNNPKQCFTRTVFTSVVNSKGVFFLLKRRLDSFSEMQIYQFFHLLFTKLSRVLITFHCTNIRLSTLAHILIFVGVFYIDNVSYLILVDILFSVDPLLQPSNDAIYKIGTFIKGQLYIQGFFFVFCCYILLDYSLNFLLFRFHFYSLKICFNLLCFVLFHLVLTPFLSCFKPGFFPTVFLYFGFLFPCSV